jgi:hypothetical protein
MPPVGAPRGSEHHGLWSCSARKIARSSADPKPPERIVNPRDFGTEPVTHAPVSECRERKWALKHQAAGVRTSGLPL